MDPLLKHYFPRPRNIPYITAPKAAAPISPKKNLRLLNPSRNIGRAVALTD
jgi:hypothetical protein